MCVCVCVYVCVCVGVCARACVCVSANVLRQWYGWCLVIQGSFETPKTAGLTLVNGQVPVQLNTNPGQRDASINWQNNGICSNSISGYEVEYNSSGVTQTATEQPASPSVGTGSITLLNLTPCTDYSVRVRANCTDGTMSNFSDFVDFTTTIDGEYTPACRAALTNKHTLHTWIGSHQIYTSNTVTPSLSPSLCIRCSTFCSSEFDKYQSNTKHDKPRMDNSTGVWRHSDDVYRNIQRDEHKYYDERNNTSDYWTDILHQLHHQRNCYKQRRNRSSFQHNSSTNSRSQ